MKEARENGCKSLGLAPTFNRREYMSREEYPPMARLKLEIRRLRRDLREAGAACTCGWEDGHALFCPRGIAEKALKRQ